MEPSGRLNPIISLLGNKAKPKQWRAVLSPPQLFSIVVFGSIVNEGYVNRDTTPELHCIYNENEGACSYGISIGIIAFFTCVFFLVVDLHFQQISSVKDRKRAVLLDLGVSGMALGSLGSWKA